MDSYISYTWTATFEFKGEHWHADIYNRRHQPSVHEFLQVLHERMHKRIDYDPSRLRLLEIRRRD